MHYNLARGVNLDVIPTKQFKANQILINFTTPQTHTNATARNLVANVLETSSKKYPTQTALARRLAQQYGTYISMGVGRVGLLHTVRLKAGFINDQLAHTNLFDQVIALIREILFNPWHPMGPLTKQPLRGRPITWVPPSTATMMTSNFGQPVACWTFTTPMIR